MGKQPGGGRTSDGLLVLSVEAELPPASARQEARTDGLEMSRRKVATKLPGRTDDGVVSRRQTEARIRTSVQMGWLTLGAALFLLPQMASAARLVVSCYDGSANAEVRSSLRRRPFRAPVCDHDYALNGACRFRLGLSATPKSVARMFDVTLRADASGRIKVGRKMAVLRCRAGPEPAKDPTLDASPPVGARVNVCQDAVFADSGTEPVCEPTPACDDHCLFGFYCPPWCGSAAPCFEEPTYTVSVPVGHYRVLPACPYTAAYVLQCEPHPEEVQCPVTTTTLPARGTCGADADCASFPAPCQFCVSGFCMGLVTLNPKGSFETVGCPLSR